MCILYNAVKNTLQQKQARAGRAAGGIAERCVASLYGLIETQVLRKISITSPALADLQSNATGLSCD